MGNISGKESASVSPLNAEQRRAFDKNYQKAINLKRPAGGNVNPVFAAYPGILGDAFTQLLSSRIKGKGGNAEKEELLNILGSAVTLDLTGIVNELLSVGKLSLAELSFQLGQYYLGIWGPELTQSKQGADGFRDFILTSHWRPGQVEDEDIKAWLKCCQENGMRPEKVEDWLLSNRQFQEVLRIVIKSALLGTCGEDDHEFAAPSVNDGTMDASLCWLLMKYVPIDCHKSWNRLYLSKTHGSSWNAFQRAITKAGPTVFIIKENVSSGTAHIFGAFSYVNWTTHPKFFGDGQAFLFTSSPQLKAYTPTTYNSNYQYFNHGAQTLPNGLGLGGQFEYFGLWIDSSFEGGSSNANPRCSTYDSPCLSQSSRFSIDQVEGKSAVFF
ncbi:TLD domain-containing protein 1 [Entomophthora muscae]|uniref:TLD domain-containing protein 1 n=1 Tax=Entomophthora muscae TaxID=34485 RepID=A0ACC2SB01_9FUNG|nr:TLD domain-containing protein 1 [Entomophthora muscae]